MMKCFYLAVGLLLILAPQGANAVDSVMIPSSIEASVRTAATALLIKYPPHNFLYVAIGRSPTIITAYLDALGIEGIHHIPGSNLRNATVMDKDSVVWSRLNRHFSIYFPTPAQLANRQLLLIDYAESGDALLVARDALLNVERARQMVRPPEISMVALREDLFSTKSLGIKPLMESQKSQIQVLQISAELDNALFGHEFTKFSPYVNFPVAEQDRPYEGYDPRRYSELVEHYRTAINSDPEMTVFKKWIGLMDCAHLMSGSPE